MQRAPGENATGKVQPTTHNIQTTCAMQRAICSEQQRRAMRKVACNVQRAVQQTTNNVEKTTDSVQRTTHNRATGNKATCVMRQTPRKRRQITGNACNRQRASHCRRYERGREHMRDAIGNIRHCRISSAASSRQQAVSMREALSSTTTAQHGTDAIHKMQHTNRDAACSKLT
jgi:hypothetical protein